MHDQHEFQPIPQGSFQVFQKLIEGLPHMFQVFQPKPKPQPALKPGRIILGSFQPHGLPQPEFNPRPGPIIHGFIIQEFPHRLKLLFGILAKLWFTPTG